MEEYIKMKTLRLACSHALIKYIVAQKIIIDGKKMPLFAGAFGYMGMAMLPALASNGRVSRSIAWL